jgi:hypothetical protein
MFVINYISMIVEAVLATLLARTVPPVRKKVMLKKNISITPNFQIRNLNKFC